MFVPGTMFFFVVMIYKNERDGLNLDEMITKGVQGNLPAKYHRDSIPCFENKYCNIQMLIRETFCDNFESPFFQFGLNRKCVD